MLVKFLLVLIGLAMVFELSSCSPKEGTFPDPNLEVAIRDAISKPEGLIYPSDLQGLTTFDASARDITNLLGLEYCTNLTELYLLRNQVSDISPLASLTNLTTLNLSENPISDISPLASLTNLSNLRLKDNPLSTTSVNVYIPQLEERGVAVSR